MCHNKLLTQEYSHVAGKRSIISIELMEKAQMLLKKEGILILLERTQHHADLAGLGFGNHEMDNWAADMRSAIFLERFSCPKRGG
jgi:hypothetical protein